MKIKEYLEKREKEIHKYIQEEVADRVIYQDRLAELALRRGLDSLESRLSIHFSVTTTGLLELIDAWARESKFKEKVPGFSGLSDASKGYNRALGDLLNF